MKARKTWKEIREKHFSKEELEEIDKEVSKEALLLKGFQDTISREVALFMAKEHLGFNDLMRRMNSSPRQISKIVKGDCNLTMVSIAELATIMGKRVDIVFK